MSVRPLRPDTRPRHGGPLPRRPADGPQTDPVAEPKLLSRCLPHVNSDLSGITLYFYRLSRTSGYVIHVLLTSPPLSALLPAARLAWLRRAASVRSEPGSNSPVQCLANHFDQTLVRSLKTNFLARSSCSVFKDQAPGSSPSQSPPFYPITKDLSNPFPLPQKLFPRPKTLASHPVQAPAAAEPPLYPIPQTLVKRFLVKKSQPCSIPTTLLQKSNKTTTRPATGRRH